MSSNRGGNVNLFNFQRSRENHHLSSLNSFCILQTPDIILHSSTFYMGISVAVLT